MDQARYDRGLKMRRQVLGDEYVDRALGDVDDFNRDFQRIITECAWGETWGDDTIKPRERSILVLGMTAGQGRMHEFEIHFRGAIRNGLTRNELRSLLTQIAIYCGFPAALDSFRIARRVLAETKTA